MFTNLTVLMHPLLNTIDSKQQVVQKAFDRIHQYMLTNKLESSDITTDLSCQILSCIIDTYL